MPPKTERKADRHLLGTLGRLGSPDDDAWLRAYAQRTGRHVSQVVSAAVRHYRSMIENDEYKEQK